MENLSNVSKRVIYGVVIIILIIVLYFFVPLLTNNEISLPQTEPVRTEFSTSTPPSIPTEFIPTKAESLKQSYELDYQDAKAKQSTVVFDSDKNLDQSFVFYKEALEKEGWSIVNTYEGSDIKSIYGVASGKEINITISQSNGSKKVGSRISISILNK